MIFTDDVPAEAEKPDMLLVDSTVWEFHSRRFPDCTHVVQLSGGEISKTPETLFFLWQKMSEAGLRRDSTVMVAGGGTVCDIGAFAVSTWKRGVDLQMVPTTLLCMVDACLGGKTAVNLDAGKNQAGTFYPASVIFADTAFLATLPEREMKCGIAEALKTSVIAGREISDLILKGETDEAVRMCMQAKGDIVSRDLEESGERKLLNLGHTTGHCIEAITSFQVPHGQAVAMGIPVAARMGGSFAFAEEFISVARKLGIDTSLPEAISTDLILKLLNTDKKTTAEGRTWIFPKTWGNCVQRVLSAAEEEELLRQALEL
ncbi:hypothetical protein CSA37_00445 [Candidatus Fermentibacteria bacterium]|nr:MAG: hypothetical protein CSA37_00445 [Candidatus Fermentibacteria bacterium]